MDSATPPPPDDFVAPPPQAADEAAASSSQVQSSLPGHAPAPEVEDETQLEFKPEVKYAAAALLLLAWVGVCVVFYRFGRQRGYDAGLASDQVTKRVNTEAVRNIAYFLQIASADDDTLLDTVTHHQERLSWVKDDVVRREALGMLLSVLVDRGLILQAEAVLREMLPPPAEMSPVWIARVQKAARSLALGGEWAKAVPFFQSVEQAQFDHGDMQAWRAALREHAALLEAGSGGSAEERESALTQLLSLPALAEAADLRAELLTLLGRVQREQGARDKAEKNFREALELVSPAGMELPSTTLACIGAANLELGQREEAEKYLKAALQRHEPAALSVCPLLHIMCLRDLSTLALNKNQTREALELLNTAKNLAESYMPPNSLFWPSLAEQRAWALFVAHDYSEGVAEFRNVLNTVEGGEERLRARPLEGIARCCLALGRVEEALPAAEECAMLRERVFPEAKESLGRVYILLGQACDQAGHEIRAAEAYGRAADILPEGHSSRTIALAARASSLTQARRWEEAALAWETAIPFLPPDDAGFRERAAAQLAACRKKAEAPAQPTPPPAAPARSRRTPTRRSR